MATQTTRKMLPAWGALSHMVFAELEIMRPNRLAEHIAQYTQNQPQLYSAHLVRYATEVDGKVIAGNLAPTQVIPVWECTKHGEGRGWSMVAAVQQFMWSAVAYEGFVYAADTDPGDQKFSVEDFLNGVKTPQDESRMMTPGGRVLHNLQTQFPWAVPLKSHPKCDQKIRTASAMSLGSFAKFFGEGEIIPGAAVPSLSLVAYDDNGPMSMFDPVEGKMVKVRLLDRMPVSMEYFENSLGMPGDVYDTVTSSVLDYLQNYAGDPDRVGLAWTSDLTINDEALSTQMVESRPTTTAAIFVQPFDDADFMAGQRLGSQDLLAGFASGKFINTAENP